MTCTFHWKMSYENVPSELAPFWLRTTNIIKKQMPEQGKLTHDHSCDAALFCSPKQGFDESIHWRLFFFFQRALLNRRKEARVHIFYTVIYWYGKSYWKQFLRYDNNIWLALSQLKVTKNLCHFLLVKHCTKNNKKTRWLPKNPHSHLRIKNCVTS